MLGTILLYSYENNDRKSKVVSYNTFKTSTFNANTLTVIKRTYDSTVRTSKVLRYEFVLSKIKVATTVWQ